MTEPSLKWCAWCQQRLTSLRAPPTDKNFGLAGGQVSVSLEPICQQCANLFGLEPQEAKGRDT